MKGIYDVVEEKTSPHIISDPLFCFTDFPVLCLCPAIFASHAVGGMFYTVNSYASENSHLRFILMIVTGKCNHSALSSLSRYVQLAMLGCKDSELPLSSACLGLAHVLSVGAFSSWCHITGHQDSNKCQPEH